LNSYSFHPFQNLILDQVFSIIERFGSNNAFCINEKYYTYVDFAQNISKIRNVLQSYKINSKNIGLVANDDIETYASIFAIWLEGYAYVPLHPNQPIDRISDIISQAKLELIINSRSNDLFSGVQTIYSNILEFNELNLRSRTISEDNLAYILFTSGSTGKPKGVPITRGSVGAFVKSFFNVGFQVFPDDRCLQSFDLTFDVSVQAFLVPLVNGACIYTIPHDQIKYSYVFGLLEEHRLTFGVMAPSMLRYLRPYFNEIDIPSMRYCILTAEASPVDLLKEWSECIPNAEIFNFYGPTEATIYCTCYKFITDGINKQANGLLSTGKAMSGVTAIIIDEKNNILGPDKKGELCIAGDQLTSGYWNNPEKNALSFFNMELSGINYRFYRTGDLCQIDEDGDILYFGRIDFQVKIQGYRIELGEIEHYASENVKGQNAVAVAFENRTGNTEIALFIEGSQFDTSILLENLKLKMPYYMIPTRIIVRENFPLNTNGKVDRNELKKLITQ
jgi:D-alanine--poly(phosphoribitol) ligase subunit 1